jgi:hypothetical protein
MWSPRNRPSSTPTRTVRDPKPETVAGAQTRCPARAGRRSPPSRVSLEDAAVEDRRAPPCSRRPAHRRRQRGQATRAAGLPSARLRTQGRARAVRRARTVPPRHARVTPRVRADSPADHTRRQLGTPRSTVLRECDEVTQEGTCVGAVEPVEVDVPGRAPARAVRADGRHNVGSLR